MRSGRLDRKIEFPHPSEDARAKILQIHSRKMNVAPDVNFEELARSSDDFNAAQLKAVSHCHCCVIAGEQYCVMKDMCFIVSIVNLECQLLASSSMYNLKMLCKLCMGTWMAPYRSNLSVGLVRCAWKLACLLCGEMRPK